MSNNLLPEFVNISIDDYRNFIRNLPELQQYSPDISQLKRDELLKRATMMASTLFSEKIEHIKKALSDNKSGIAASDIAELTELGPDENAYWGVVIALALGSNLFKLSKDIANQTPYTIHAASYEQSKELVKLGLDTIAPEKKLGFHTDGIISGTQVFMPHNIMLYNVIIEYKNPGNFYWVPFELWTQKKLFMDRIGIGKRYRIRVTPSIYEFGKGKVEVVSPHEIQAPIFVEDPTEGYPLYLNGEVIGACDDDGAELSEIADLKNSISRNKLRYVIPQKARRIIFVSNTKGAHARDVFEESITGVTYTRVFMRSVDTNSIDLNK